MAKDKKPTGGEHATKRVNVGFPEQWHAVARRLAAKNRQPVLYTIIALLIDAAKEAQIGDLPVPPWETDATTESGNADNGATGSASDRVPPGRAGKRAK